MQPEFDALLVLSFGGPEHPDEVMPFLERVSRGRNIPRERLLEVAENYYLFGGISPINEQCRALIAALRAELDVHGVKLPIYWGNRNWHPLIEETVAEMKAAGVRRVLVLVTSAYGGYSACRQYLEDLERVAGTELEYERLPHYYLRSGCLEPLTESLDAALGQIPDERRAATRVLFTAHSIPVAMAETSSYVEQLNAVARSVASASKRMKTLTSAEPWRLVFQSRSGAPHQPWLEPDVRDALAVATDDGVRDVVVAPIGFISDHMEVKFDLDTQAARHAAKLGLNMVRAATVGTHPKFIEMLRIMIEERLQKLSEPWPWPCLENCCASPHRAGSPRG